MGVDRSRYFTKAAYDAWMVAAARDLAGEWAELSDRERIDTVECEVGLCDWTFHREGAEQILEYTNNLADFGEAEDKAGGQADMDGMRKVQACMSMEQDLRDAVLKKIEEGNSGGGQ